MIFYRNKLFISYNSNISLYFVGKRNAFKTELDEIIAFNGVFKL